MELNTTLIRYSHKVGLNYWHMEWCTKYRYKMMKKLENKNLVWACIKKAAKEHGIEIHILKVLQDHIHLLASLPKGMLDSKALNLLKGRSAYLIFRNKEKTRLRYPQGHFWSPGACAVTVGYNDLDAMINYIQSQEQHHNVVFA